MQFENPTEEALEIWQQLIGLRGEDKAGTLGQWQLHDTLTALKEAFEIDRSELTATLMLRHFMKEFLGTKTYSLENLLSDNERAFQDVMKARRLRALLERPEIKELEGRFLKAVGAGLSHYGVSERDDVSKITNDAVRLAFLRRDALRSLAKLKFDQFFDGPSENAETRPVYQKMVHQWTNINSMLNAAVRMPSGVSLNLIRDQDAYHSFFCFLVKNGANIIVLSDAPSWTHPLQPSQSRRPDREMDDRIAKNWFPYQIMNLETDENGRLAVGNSSADQLVAFQAEAHAVLPIDKLTPQQLVWTLMMFDLIVERFFRRGEKAPALSYTGEMIRVQDRLEKAANASGLPVKGYQPLDMKALTVDDVASATEEDGIGQQSSHWYKWLEDRYQAKVSAEALNPVSSPDVLVLLDSSGRVEQRRKQDVAKLNYFEEKALEQASSRLHSLDATSFGTRENIAQNRMFIARYNYAQQLSKLARQEFEERRDEVLSWYEKAVWKNKNALLKMAGYGLIWLDNSDMPPLTDKGACGPTAALGMSEFSELDLPKRMRSLSRLIPAKSKAMSPYSLAFTINVEKYDKRLFRKCAMTGGKPDLAVIFQPTNAVEVAVLAGVDPKRLPDVLQNYSIGRPYTGNNLISRIDPMEWALDNPWSKLNLQVGVPLTRASLMKLGAKAELPAALEKLAIKGVPKDIARNAWNVDDV